MDEGKRVAREAARALLSELDVQDEPSSVENAMDFCHLEHSRTSRIRWVSAHETGHYAIREHNEILRFCNTFDLSAEARRQLELEANEFAAEFLFQGNRFVEACMSEQFSLTMLRTMSDGFGVSYEAGFRRFVEENPMPVALLVSRPLKATPGTDDGRVILAFGASPTRLRYGAYSLTFRRQFGIADVRQVFDAEHPISQATASGQSMGEIPFRDQQLTVESFYNQYDVLSIIRPAARS